MSPIDADRLDEAVLDPWDIFQHRGCGVPIGEVYVHLAHIADMGHDRKPMRMGGMRNLDIFGDSGQARHVGLDILHRACPDKGAERLRGIELLAKSDRD